MAKKKHHKKVGVRRTHHRRVGAHTKFEKAALISLGVIGGGIVAPFIINALQTAAGSQANLPGWMIPGAVGLGGGGLMLVDMPIVMGAGAGILSIGAVMAANEIGLNEPGIAGLAFGHNGAPGATVLSRALGCRDNGTTGAIQQTVGAHGRRTRKAMAVGALISD